MRQASSGGQPGGLAAALALVAMLLAPGLATADPVAFLPPAGSPVDIKFVDHESLFCAPGVLCAPGPPPIGAFLEGIATATSIGDPVSGDAYWLPGVSDGSELNALFKGLTVVASFVTPTTIETYLDLGTIDIYNIPLSGPGVFVLGAPAGPAAVLAQVCPGGACPPAWLSAVYALQGFVDPDGGGPATPVPYTLKTTLDTVSGTGSSVGWLSLTGGTAFSSFNSNAFVTPAGVVADAAFNNDFQVCPAVGCAPGWPLKSDDPISAVVTPEPTTLLLWGTSLLGLATIARWRRRPEE